MAKKSVEQIKRESDEFKRASLNATLRKRLQNSSKVDVLRELEFVERLIEQDKTSIYYYGGSCTPK